MIDSYEFKEVTTGFWKVTTAPAGETKADKDVYAEDGTVIPAGTILTVNTSYYAKVDTTFTLVTADKENVTHTVNLNSTDYTMANPT